MTAGLPGTGIGGLFYLLSALLMPIRELWRIATGTSQPAARRLAVRQATLALLILTVAWLTGAALAAARVRLGEAGKDTNILLITLLTLGGVLAAIEVLSALLRMRAWIAARLSDQAPAAGGDR